MPTDYDLIVIGGGAAGLTISAVHGEVGRKVALIERERLGGDCTWTGCVPSKALIKVARVAHSARTAAAFGVHTPPPTVEMKDVRAYLRSVVESIYQQETPEAFAKHGMDILLGEARFLDPHTIQLGDRRLSAKKFAITTGARPLIPPITGLANVPFETNLTIFDNDRLPAHLLILGAGPVGIELGQAYARLGSRVTLVGEMILAREEPEAVEVILGVLAREGVRVLRGRVEQVSGRDGAVSLHLAGGEVVQGDRLLLATGRKPNVEALDLANAGVEYRADGIPVDRHLRTNVRHIYAAGDVTTGPKFTHFAGQQAMAAARNLLLPLLNARGDATGFPRVTFTDPEIAHVGLSEAEARARYGDAVRIYHFPLTEGDRTVAERDTDGFIKLIYRGSSTLLGACIVAGRAGEMITEYTLAVDGRVSLSALDATIHPYPTYADVAKKALSQLLVQSLFESASGRLLRRFARWLP